MSSYYEKIGNETRCIDEEIPFEVPDGWEWHRLINICNAIHYGFTASASPIGNSKLLRITDIQDNKVDWKSVPFCNVTENELTVYKLFNNDILIARTGGTIGKTYIVDNLKETSVFASYLIRAIPNEKICPAYLKYYMESPFYWKQLTKKSMGTGQPNVNGESLKSLLVSIPPLAEQKYIVYQLELIESYLFNYENLEQQEAQLQTEFPDKLKRSILQSAIQGKLVAQNPDDEPASILLDKIRKEKEQLVKAGKIKNDKNESVIFKNTDDNSYYESRNGKVLCIDDEISFEIPNSWEWVRLGSITQHNTGKTLDKGRNKGILHKYITTSNLYWGYFDLSELREMPFEIEELDRCTVSKGDLLICEGGEAGRSAIWYSENSICFQNHIHRVRPYANICSEYLLCYMEKIYRTGEINIYRKGVGIQSLSGNSLASILIPLPPINEQNRIVEKIKLLFAVFS